MRRSNLPDEGAGSVEAGLLLTGIIVVVLPSVFAVGYSVRDSLDDSCASVPDQRCSSGGAPMAQPLVDSPTRRVETAVAQRVQAEDPEDGPAEVECDEISAVTPPAGTSIECTVRRDQTGEETTVLITWLDDSGTFEITQTQP